MTPMRQFTNGLKHVRGQFLEDMDELLAFAEVLALKQNSIELDENGMFFVTATGPLEQVIPIMYQQLEKLERIKEQKDKNH